MNYHALDLKEGADDEKIAKNVAIPLLMGNKLPVKLGDNGDEILDVSLMPEEVCFKLYYQMYFFHLSIVFF